MIKSNNLLITIGDYINPIPVKNNIEEKSKITRSDGKKKSIHNKNSHHTNVGRMGAFGGNLNKIGDKIHFL